MKTMNQYYFYWITIPIPWSCDEKSRIGESAFDSEHEMQLMGKKNFEDFVDDDEIPADMSKKETIVNAASKNISAVKEILKYCIILF